MDWVEKVNKRRISVEQFLVNLLMMIDHGLQVTKEQFQQFNSFELAKLWPNTRQFKMRRNYISAISQQRCKTENK